MSTRLGLKGIPSISEEMMVRRDLALLAYTNGKLHLGPLSSSKSIELVNEAKKDKLSITTEVTVAHLAFSEEELTDFDTNYKVIPPLREESNRKALITALSEGKIDVISSDHTPEDEEHKKLEFDLAKFGMASMELFFPLVLKAVENKIPIDELISKFSISPRETLGITVPKIEVGEKANLTIFQKHADFRSTDYLSKAFNIPKLPNGLKGKVVRTIYANE